MSACTFKVLLLASEMGCSDEVLTIVSMLSANHHTLFMRPKKMQREADSKKMRFNDYKGDHITLVRDIYISIFIYRERQ